MLWRGATPLDIASKNPASHAGAVETAPILATDSRLSKFAELLHFNDFTPEQLALIGDALQETGLAIVEAETAHR